MLLRNLRVQNFQSFSDSDEILLEEGFNLIIGQNNSGKSALLRAMLPEIPDDRHRTPDRWKPYLLPEVRIALTIEVSGSKLREWVLRLNGQYYFPIANEERTNFDSIINEIFENGTVSLKLLRTHEPGFHANYPSHGRFKSSSRDKDYSVLLAATQNGLKLSLHKSEDTLPALFWSSWAQDLFYFKAERLNVGESPHGHASKLAPDASNLPNVLHTLGNERGSVFKRLVRYLSEIFPTVGNLSVRSRPDNNQLEIRVWPTEAMEEVELSFALSSSGTGVAQVIAILTAIMTIKNAVIIIDEINSFLHPAAVKSLLRILQSDYSQHQYIISTHAPELISFSNPKSVHLVKRAGYNSTVKRLNLSDLNEFRELAGHLGVSMTDIFAAERVVWVEGQTEELCFPYIYKAFCGQPVPKGTIITPVVATGDFNRKKDRKLVYSIYERLSKSGAALFVETVFSFDSEGLKDSQKKQMTKESGNKLLFLPRRHLECYLINPQAISDLIAIKDPSLARVVTGETVAKELSVQAASKGLEIPVWKGVLSDEKWLAEVDAANLISKVVSEISDSRATFNKKEDSFWLVKELVARDKESLKPLYDYVSALINAE